MKTDFVVILVTCASRKEARRIADALLRKRLAACANIVTGVESKFWWKAKIDKAREVLLILKTSENNFAKIEREVKRIHSYDVPEIAALPITAGSKNYLDWINDSLLGL